MGRRIREIKQKLASVSNDKNFLLEVRYEESREVVRRGRETHSFVHQEDVIGRDEDKMKIVKLLLDQDESGENASVIPIMGIGGLGKTTLAQSVFNEKTVQQHFELKIWLCVSDNFDLKLILQQIIKSATNNNDLGAIDSMDQLQKELRKELDGKRYLLVLDDVWEENREKWLKLKDLLISGSSQGTRIIITTRSKVVATITGTVQPYQLGILDEEKSWSLFERMAFTQAHEPRNPKKVEIGRKIVKRCGGIPLAIRTIGRMLYFKKSEVEWLSFNREFSKISPQKEDDILPTLKLSYDNLTSHLKRCFSYCRLFPKDYKIKVQTLIKLWMAQGLLNLEDPSHDQCLEDVGYGYFMDLLERLFFQEIQIDEWGNVERCKMHDLIHDLATEIAGTKCATISLNSRENMKMDTRHVSFDFTISSYEKISTLLVQASKIRTFLLLGHPSWENKWNKSTCEAIISDCKVIRALDLNDSGITVLPKSIGRCKHLRYLDLSGNWKIKMLPNMITDLLNLQTLRLNDCLRLQELPRDLKKLVNLRHLEIEGYNKLTHMPSGLSQLTNLQTLSKYVLPKSNDSIPRHGGKLEELKGLINLRGKLEILNLGYGKDATTEYESANLKGKKFLRSLELTWYSDVNKDGTDQASAAYEMSMEALRPHPNIQELSLGNYGGDKFSSWLSSLTNLVSLSLLSCKKCQHLVPLNEFHLLENLELEDFPCLEYINGEEGLLPMIKLPSLRDLRLRNLPNLKGWWRNVAVSRELVENSETQHMTLLPCFPCLSMLFISDCPKLSCMPLYPHLKILLELSNTSMKPFQQTLSLQSTNTRLTSLFISRIKDLKCLPGWFKSLTCLITLKIEECSTLKDLSPGIQHLTSLKNLSISGCKELEQIMMLNGDAIMWKSLNNIATLHTLFLSKFHKMVALPEGIQHLTNLQALDVWDWGSLTTIPEWIGNLSSLKNLSLSYCPKLNSLPQGIQSLTRLEALFISDCAILLKRCQRQIGEDWPKIAHVHVVHLLPDPNEDNDQIHIKEVTCSLNVLRAAICSAC